MADKLSHQLPVGCDMPPAHRGRGTVWLEIHEGDGGYYLFQFTDKNAPCKWDSFDTDLDDILEDCRSGWGIEYNAWQPVRGGPGGGRPGLTR